MNDGDVSKQIQQMIRFIRQEAEEKANEISVSAEEVPWSLSYHLNYTMKKCRLFTLIMCTEAIEAHLFLHSKLRSICKEFVSQYGAIRKFNSISRWIQEEKTDN